MTIRIVEIQDDCDSCSFAVISWLFPLYKYYCKEQTTHVRRGECNLPTRTQYIQQVIEEALGDNNDDNS